MISFWLLAGLLTKKAQPDEPQFVLGGSRRRKRSLQSVAEQASVQLQRQNEALVMLLT